MQPSQYKDGKNYVSHSRQLFAKEKLNQDQARPFLPHRPVEELYNLETDPFELDNLAPHPDAEDTLLELREALKNWMIESADLGLIPEPHLEELGKQFGAKYYVLQQNNYGELVEERSVNPGEKDL